MWIRYLSQIYLGNLFCNFAKISVFQQRVSTVYSDNRLYIVLSVEKITESSKKYSYYWVLTILDLPNLSRRYQPTGQTWLIDIYAMLQQNVSFLECFWRYHAYFIRYCNKPTEITRNHFCDIFLENQKYLREMFLRRLRDVTEKTSFLRHARDVLKTSHKRNLFWDVFETS